VVRSAFRGAGPEPAIAGRPGQWSGHPSERAGLTGDGQIYPWVMSVTVNLPDAIAQRLGAEATRRGRGVDQVRAEVIAAGLPHDAPEAPSMREIFVDFNHVGHAYRFRTRLFRSERKGLAVSDIVLVVGDAVEPRRAQVLQLADEGREAELAFLDAPFGARD